MGKHHLLVTGDGFETLSQSFTVRRGNNPVLRWMASNAATEMDGPGNLKFSKKKSKERIDGITATTMSLGRAMVSTFATGPLFFSGAT